MDPERELYSVSGHSNNDEEDKQKLLLSWKERETEEEYYHRHPSLLDRIYREIESETTPPAGTTFSYPHLHLHFNDAWDGQSSNDSEEKERHSDIQDSIDAIREEASRIDAVLAMDQLDTLKQELDEVRRQLHHKTSELAEKRSLLKVKDHRLATLELERDLYKADTHKLKTDLTKIRKQEQDGVFNEESKSATPSQDSWGETSQFVCDAVQDHSMTPRTRARGLLCSQSLRTAEANFLGPTMRLASIIASRKKKERSLSQVPLMSSMHPPPWHRQPHRLRETTLPLSEIEIPAITLDAQVEELHHRLKASMETAEELRRRLAMVSCYYETTIRRLQSRLMATKFDQANMEERLLRQIANAAEAKKRAVTALEAKLREKDDEIDRLRGSQ